MSSKDIAKSKEEEQAAVQAALDAALDELDDDDNDDEDSGVVSDNDEDDFQDAAQEVASPEIAVTTTNPPRMIGPPRPPPPSTTLNSDKNNDSDDPAEQMLAQMMQQMMVGGNGGGGAPGQSIPEIGMPEMGADEEAFLGNLLNEMRSQLEKEFGSSGGIPLPQPAKSTSPNKKSAKQASSTKKTTTTTKAKSKQDTKNSKPKESGNVKEAIADLVEEMSKPTTVPDDNVIDNDDDFEGENELDMLSSLLQGVAGGDFNADAVVDGMMEQLLSKDLMYEPMKQVATKFPSWLEQKKDQLSAEEYLKRTKQYECFKQLVHVYENDPGNVTKLMEYMQEVQEYGQPPLEIIHEIAPGLELDEEGMPKFDGPIPPFMAGANNDECRMM